MACIKFYCEDSRRTYVSGRYDVVVIGGGIAGVSAALAAVRCGAKTALIEKQYGLGGLATLGNVTIYLPLCDGLGTQVSAGIAEELLKLCVSDGFDKIPECWRGKCNRRERKKHRYMVDFNPALFMLELERVVLSSGVDLLYDTRLCGSICKGNHIDAVVVENKSGRSALVAKSFVDASGDADLCYFSGEKTVSLSTNVCCGWYYYVNENGINRAPFSKPYDPYGKKAQAGEAFAGDNAREVTEQITRSRASIYRQIKKLRKSDTDATLINIPTVPALRMTRRIVGELELQETDDHKIFDDCVGIVSDWRKPGPVYYIPLRALIGRKNSNLFVAGRNISADSVWDVTRSIPACAVTGQAAGLAAALGENPSYNTIRKGLLQQEVLLP